MNKANVKVDAPKQDDAVEVKPVKMISTTELIALLMYERGANIISFVHTSNMSDKGKMRKTGNPYHGNLYKDQQVNGMINFFYEEGVQRRVEKEAKATGEEPVDFKVGRSYHEPIFRTDGTLTPFARHKKDPRRIFLRLMLNNSTNVRYHTAKGQKIDTDAVKPFISKPSDYKNQGLEKPLIFQVWKVEGIKTMTINGQKYQIVK